MKSNDLSWRKNYYLFQSANFISLFGEFLGGIALHWWVLEHSEGMSEISIIFMVGTIIRLVSLPLLGPVGDSFSRKKIINLADQIACVICVMLAVFIYFSEPNIPILCLLTGASTIANSLFRTGSIGMTPELVPAEKMPWAISQNQILANLAIIIGGAVGTLFISLMGVFYTIVLNAITLGIAVILIRLIDTTKLVISETHEPITIRKYGRDFIQGLHLLGTEKILLASFALIIAVNFLLTPFDLILPYYIQKIHLASVWELGLIESSIGIGSIVGSFLLSRKILGNNALSTIISALLVMAISLYFFGLALGVNTLIILGGLLGLGEVLLFIPIRTKIVIALPHRFRSRIGVIFAFGQQLGKPLAIAYTATLIKSYAPATVLSGIAVLMLTLIPTIILMPFYSSFLKGDSVPVLTKNAAAGSLNL